MACLWIVPLPNERFAVPEGDCSGTIFGIIFGHLGSGWRVGGGFCCPLPRPPDPTH